MPTHPSLQNRTVIVTGGARGLGKVMALDLIRQGAKVLITGVNPASGAMAATLAEAEAIAPGACRGVVADVGSEADCRRTVDAALEAFGRIDVLVNNAGLGPSVVQPEPGKATKVWEAKVDGYRRLVETNVLGPFLMARLVAPLMIAQGFGRIVNVSTSRTTMVKLGSAPYGASKTALEACSVVWAQELDGTGVTVNVLAPGAATDTDFIVGDGVGQRGWPGFAPGKGMGEEGDASQGLLPAWIMGPPMCWLASNESAGFTGRRVIARHWDVELEPAVAAEAAMDAVSWPPKVM